MFLKKKRNNHETMHDGSIDIKETFKDISMQWFPNYARRHTAAQPYVIRCAAKNIEIKINEVEFLKFHPADFCQYSTLSILRVVIRYAVQYYDNRAIAIFVLQGNRAIFVLQRNVTHYKRPRCV